MILPCYGLSASPSAFCPLLSGAPVMLSLSRRHLSGVLTIVAALSLTGAAAEARTGPDSFAPLVKRVLPSVVNIGVTETVVGTDPLAGLPPELRRQFRERFRQHSEQVQGA